MSDPGLAMAMSTSDTGEATFRITAITVHVVTTFTECHDGT